MPEAMTATCLQPKAGLPSHVSLQDSQGGHKHSLQLFKSHVKALEGQRTLLQVSRKKPEDFLKRFEGLLKSGETSPDIRMPCKALMVLLVKLEEMCFTPPR